MCLSRDRRALRHSTTKRVHRSESRVPIQSRAEHRIRRRWPVAIRLHKRNNRGRVRHRSWMAQQDSKNPKKRSLPNQKARQKPHHLIKSRQRNRPCQLRKHLLHERDPSMPQQHSSSFQILRIKQLHQTDQQE